MNLVASFNFSAAYSQIVVGVPGHTCDFSDWSEQHVAQGFTWSPSHVSFGTIADGIDYIAEIWQAQEVSLRASAIRAILVPFFVDPSGIVRVEDLMGTAGVEIQISEGEYALVFETGFREEYGNDYEYMWCRLTFIPMKSAQVEILRADPDLSPSYPLRMGKELGEAL